MFVNRGRGFKVSFKPVLLKVLVVSPVNCISCPNLSYLYITLHFWVMVSLSLEATRRLFMVLSPLKFAANVLKVLTKLFSVGQCHVDVVSFVVVRLAIAIGVVFSTDESCPIPIPLL